MAEGEPKGNTMSKREPLQNRGSRASDNEARAAFSIPNNPFFSTWEALIIVQKGA